MKGVVKTRVGYAGGKKKDPSYRSLGDHSETIQIDYDPTRITYDQLLDVFWNEHDPTYRSWSRQYKSAIFYLNATQKQAALDSKNRHAARLKKTIHTEILPMNRFYLAESYHQKYQLRQQRNLMLEFKSIYPNNDDFINSTAAARINGYLGGYGSAEQLKDEIDRLGLSPAGRQFLVSMVGGRKK